MPSTFSDLKIELIATGEQSGTWGNTTNDNLGTALEQAIVGKADITVSSTSVTLLLTDTNALQNARALFLNLTGSPGGAAVLEVPAIEKNYIVKNGTNEVVTIKVTGQTGVAIPVGRTALVYNNGGDVGTAIDFIPSLALGAALPVASGGTGITSFGTGVATFLGTPSSANLAAAVTDETGTGALVLATSPTLVTPILGTPTSGTLTNATGLPLTTGVTGTLPVANGGTGITSLGTGVATFLGTPSSANLAAAVTDETGSGSLVFATSPTLVTPALGTPASGTLTNATGLPLSTGVTGTLPVANGGTGATTLTAENVILGDGTSAVKFVAPGTSGNVLASNGTTWTSTAPSAAGFTLGTPVNSTSGTAIDFTGIPSGVKQIVISFITVSTDGSSNPRIQIGDSGGIENTGYVSTSHSFVAGTVSVTTSTAGWDIKSASDTNQLSGSVTLTLENSSSNTWAIQGIMAAAGANSTFTLAGTKSLSAVLDRLRITTINGSDAFDLGQVNIAYI